MAFTMLEALARNLSIRFGVSHVLPANVFPANATGSPVTTSLPLMIDDRTAVAGSTVSAPGQGDALVASATLVSPTALAASANNPALNLVRVNQSTGAVVATVGTLALASTALTALKPASFTITAANADMNPGEVLALQAVTPATTGVALPANCLVQVEITRS